MKGRPPTPIPLRLLEGNPGRRPIPTCPTARAGRPRPMAPLNEEAEREFKRLAHELARMRLASPADAALLTLLASTWVTWCRATKLLDALSDDDFMDAPGRRLRALRSDASAVLLRCWQECGLTPAARARIHVKPLRPRDELTAFLEGQGGDRA